MTTRRLLGLFPYFDHDAVGGIQASARIAWELLGKEGGIFESAALFCYADKSTAIGRSSDGRVLIVDSKKDAVYQTLRRRWNEDLVVVWHLGLIKLLPSFRLARPRVVLMLLGIEAWKRLDFLTRIQVAKVNLFLSISDHTWRKFVEINPYYKGKPHQTVLLGIGSPFTGEVSPPAATPIALMLSRLSKGENYKGHREVINAWPRVLRQMPDAKLWIAGDGDLRDDLERLVAESGLQNKVRFWGRVEDEKKEQLLQESRCLVMPSRGEGFGLVYLEAMRIGRPCLVSTLDAGQEVVNPPEAGLAADPDNEEELASAICRLLADGAEWQQWSTQARRRYEENYTAKQFQERLLAALFLDNATKPADTGLRPSEFSNV